jgi:beta-galactosidase
MKRWLAVPAIFAFLCAAAFGQSAAVWFPSAQMTTLGVYYYPEAWPREQWARDIANIRKFGFEFVHLAEFSWAFLEPEEGKYQLDWLDEVVKLAAGQGLKVVLCTPSAAPPVWLVRKHREVLMVDGRGRRLNHGSREHADWTSPVYREYVVRIDTELAKRFGANPAVWGWQIDNELSHYGSGASFTPVVTERFRQWLQKKYGTVERLNRDWGNAFWSQMYNRFDQIDPPNALELVAQPNPHALLDFQRWFADDAAEYLRLQAETLRRYVKNQWITTNYMPQYRDVDPVRSARALDVFTWTQYPVHGRPNEGPLGFRLGDPYFLAFSHGLMRSINGLSGLMELQPGQVNWSNVNPWPLPGAMRLWVMHAFGSGAQLVCTYRYRQPLSGGELYHKGIVETDGVTLSPGGREWVQAMREIVDLRRHRPANPAMPPAVAARRTAFLIGRDNWWDIDNHLQTERWDTAAHWMRYIRALKSMGAPVDVVTEGRPGTDRYPFLIAPAYQLLDSELVGQWRSYVERGGHLILTARTGHKDRRGHLWEGPWAAPILDLIGASIPMYDLLPGKLTGKVRFEGKEYEWGSWGEVLDPRPGTTVLATYSDQFYAEKPAAVTRRLGRGTVTYVGVDTLDGEFERAVLTRVFATAGAAPLDLPPGLMVDWRDGFWVASNFTGKRQAIPAGPDARLLLGSRQLEPAGVAVWLE